VQKFNKELDHQGTLYSLTSSATILYPHHSNSHGFLHFYSSIPQEIGKDGMSLDNTGESLDLSSSEVNSNIISSNFTKTRMNSDDNFSSDSQSMSCEKFTKIGIHKIQTSRSKETDEECCKTSRRSSRRIIDCSQDCPICWDSFKIGEQICFSKNVSCR
jgi:hypothetical protein